MGHRLAPWCPHPDVAGHALPGVALAVVAALAIGCEAGPPPPTPPIVPGDAVAPREVNLIARDYAFEPPTLDIVPGETVILHVVNAGLTVHEAIIGTDAVQAAWEAAESAAADPPPGPTPMVSVAPESSGIRVVVASGERVDIRWTAPTDGAPLVVGCHIPGHWERGMRIAVRWVPADDSATSAADPPRWYALVPPPGR